MEEERSYISSVLENKACEVGFATYCLQTGQLYLSQFIESSRCYATTLMMLRLYNPSELVIVGGGQIPQGLNAATSCFQQTPLVRAAFDDSQGYTLLCKYSGALQLESTAYLAYGAAGALLRWLESEHKKAFRAGTLEVIVLKNKAHMSIDPATSAVLELTQPYKTLCGAARHSSLFTFLNNTTTKAGSRLLRANVLQPLRDIPTISARMDTVDELVKSADLMHEVMETLKVMPKDFDKILGNLTLQPSKSEAGTLRRINTFIQSLVHLQDLLRCLPSLATVLENANSDILVAVQNACNQTCFANLLDELESTLDENAHGRKGAFMNRTQQCFAVKTGINGLLDISRSTFSRLTEQVHELANEYSKRHQLKDLKVQYNGKRGFYLTLAAKSTMTRAKRRKAQHAQHESRVEGDDENEDLPQRPPRLPHGFQVITGSKSLHCTTAELNALNARLTEAANDCSILTEQVLDKLSADVAASYLIQLRRLVDNIALLDVLCSFARTASSGTSTGNWVRPILTEAGPLAIIRGRHPMSEAIIDTYCPNDTYLSFCSSLHIITGPNMSGKTTYLKQVAMIVILAQIGCRVPADFASLTPIDNLMARMGSGDCLETNRSSFMVEMQEMSDILQHSTAQSLVLIDELGRATSTADGLAIAWAIGEALIEKGVPTLFATHFPQLRDLSKMYPTVKDWVFHVDTSRERLEFTWQLKSGGSDLKRYGILLARSVGFPEDILKTAEEIATSVEQAENERYREAISKKGHEREVEVYKLIHKMACLSQSTLLPVGPNSAMIRKQMRKLKEEAIAFFEKFPVKLDG